MVPAERRESIRFLVANVLPILFSVCTRPLGAMAEALAAITRDAKGISAVIAIIPGLAFSAIQSSAASNLSDTMIRSTFSASRGIGI